jgi:hypothetical protein
MEDWLGVNKKMRTSQVKNIAELLEILEDWDKDKFMRVAGKCSFFHSAVPKELVRLIGCYFYQFDKTPEAVLSAAGLVVGEQATKFGRFTRRLPGEAGVFQGLALDKLRLTA